MQITIARKVLRVRILISGTIVPCPRTWLLLSTGQDKKVLELIWRFTTGSALDIRELSCGGRISLLPFGSDPCEPEVMVDSCTVSREKSPRLFNCLIFKVRTREREWVSLGNIKSGEKTSIVTNDNLFIFLTPKQRTCREKRKKKKREENVASTPTFAAIWKEMIT